MRMISLALAALFACCSMKASAAGREWSIQGTMLTSNGILADATLSISADGKIASVGPTPPNPEGVAPLKVSGIVLPGFIDLHNHLTWNVQPRWLPGRKFFNRYEWQDAAEYDRVLSNPHYVAMNAVSCEAEIYAEVKALAGGATSVLGGLLRNDAHPANQKCVAGLTRNLDTDSGFQQPTSDNGCPTAKTETDRRLLDVVDNEIFPLELTHDRFDYLLCALGNKTLRGLVVHLSEGASTDSAAHREYSMLSKAILLGGPDGKMPIVREGLAIVHGTALRDADFSGMKSSKVGLVWSPRSNDELYGSTTNIALARLAGVDVAIAPDWSPSGSAGMLQEMGYASRHYGIGSGDLLNMATSIPAKLVRISDYVGVLARDKYADLVVINAKVDPAKPNPLDPIIKATPADIALVVVGGQPIYGTPDLLKQLLPHGSDLSTIKVCGAEKAIDLSGTVAAAQSWKFDDIKDHLKRAFDSLGSSVAEIECD